MASAGLTTKESKTDSSVTTYIKENVVTGVKNVVDGLLAASEPVGEGIIITIGKPYAFNQNVDPYGRLSNYVKTKMSVIDLIPCQCEINLTKLKRVKEGENPLLGGFFRVSYDEQIKIFNEICELHGLKNKEDPKFYGLRLYTTDGTTATDSFNIQYAENILQQSVNSLSDFVRKLHDAFRSFGINSIEFQQKSTAQMVGKVDNSAVQKALMSLADILVKGNRLSFPKIWQNSTYTSNLSAQIRLVSPYGHPRAIKEFILRPLMLLIILAAPHTSDGLSYGNCIPLTIKAYGMNYTVLGSINSITLRRGGDDTCFNIYRQPLVVDVSIDFQTLLEGFAVYRPLPSNLKQYESQIPDYKVFKQSKISDPTTATIDSNALKDVEFPLPTLGTILRSLQPFSLVDGHFQVYGNFRRPDKYDLPKTGIVGSLASGAMAESATNLAELDPFSYALKSAKSTAEKLGLDAKTLSNVDDVLKSKFKNNFKF